jgi:preprotein translocase subunit SecB
MKHSSASWSFFSVLGQKFISDIVLKHSHSMLFPYARERISHLHVAKRNNLGSRTKCVPENGL